MTAQWALVVGSLLGVTVGLLLFHPRSPISGSRFASGVRNGLRRIPGGQPSLAGVMVSGTDSEKRRRLRRLRWQGAALWTAMSVGSAATRLWGYLALFAALDVLTFSYCQWQLRRLQ